MILSMLKRLSHRAGRAAILLAALGVPATAALAQSYPVTIGEDASAKLVRNLKILGSSPRDFGALIAAGQASLELGDTQAAAGFFGRAEEANPNNFQPKAGMGAAMVAMGDPTAALTYFGRAQALGASQAAIGTDRGLAYDLLGDQARAQLDYRAALFGPNRDEARRRLALSLAISRDIKGAAETIEPLLVRRDPQAYRINAFVLALGGDRDGARRTIDMFMPGAGARFEPFFKLLPELRAEEKAAAVHLGEFPRDAAQRYAQVVGSSPVGSIGPRATIAGPRYTDRLGEIEELLRAPADAPAQSPSRIGAVRMASAAPPPAPRPKVERVRMANVQPRRDLASAGRSASDSGKPRIWLQLASGPNAAALPAQFRRIKGRNSKLLDGFSGYVAEEGERARLLIGPFNSLQDAETFAGDLASVNIDAFGWQSASGQSVRKLPTE